MSAIKVEGSIGQLPDAHLEAREPETEGARFAQLMLRALPPAANRRVVTANLARYRVVGGPLDGVECEVSETAQAVRLRLYVHCHRLYRTLKTSTGWLEHHLQCPGYAVTLEIHYVKRGV
ncbi:type III secretion system protein SsaP [Kosakonia sp. BYX6]|uniref:Type III secretion system protein SsaP n=1 Tax=Kosakonia calanthes TaxID=3139408 RepID=A0ABZ3B6L3_9ENTR